MNVAFRYYLHNFKFPFCFQNESYLSLMYTFSRRGKKYNNLVIYKNKKCVHLTMRYSLLMAHILLFYMISMLKNN